MYYLLVTNDPHEYILFRRRDHQEQYYNDGVWSSSLPHLTKDFTTLNINDKTSYTNWWHYSEDNTVNATLLFKGPSLQSYFNWCDEHPELQI